MIRINLLRPQHFGTTEGESKIIQAMLKNAYDSGYMAGERWAYLKVIDLLHEKEKEFLFIHDRRRAQREDLIPEIERMNLEVKGRIRSNK